MTTNKAIGDFAWFPTLFDSFVYIIGLDDDLNHNFYNYAPFLDVSTNLNVSSLSLLPQEMEVKLRMNEDYGIIFPSTFRLLQAEGPQSAELCHAWKHLQDLVTRCKKQLLLDNKWKEVEKSLEIVLKDLTIYDNSFRRNLLRLCQDKYVDGVSLNFEGIDYLSAALISVLNLDFVRELEDSLELDKYINKLVEKCKQMPKVWRNHEICANLDNDLYFDVPSKKIGTSGEFFERVMLNSSIKLQDRVIFGVCLLPDDKLSFHLDRLANECVAKGDLTGLFVTVASQQTEELLQSYVELTQDLQTSVLMAAQISGGLLNTPFVSECIKKYQSVLNSAKLWDVRFKFENFLHTRRYHLDLPQIDLLCILCHKSLSFSTFKKEIEARHLVTNRIYPNARLNKKGACNFCLNPQPHCSVCRRRVNVYSLSRPSSRLVGDDRLKATSVERWLAFCMKCHHGGHNGHIIEWFRFTSVCPVDTCDCVCIHDIGPLVNIQFRSQDDLELEEELVTL